MLKKLDTLTTFKGRMNRADYWFYLFTSVVISAFGAIVLVGMASLLHPQPEMTPVTILIFAIKGVFTIASLIVAFSAIVRRLHDLNLTGYLALLLLVLGIIPLLPPLALIVLGCVPARNVANRYS